MLCPAQILHADIDGANKWATWSRPKYEIGRGLLALFTLRQQIPNNAFYLGRSITPPLPTHLSKTSWLR